MKAPIVICALGGSGSRIVARVLRHGGYFIGSNVNESEDAMEFVEFYDRWINRYLLREKVPLCREEEELMNGDFLSCIARHRIGITSYDSLWGWKEPRSHFLLPFIYGKYPEMKLIHVVRDGRDMAFSENQNQLRKHGAAVLDLVVGEVPEPVRAAALWAKVNLSIAQYADRVLAGRYLVVQFENLCACPREIVKIILGFLGSSNVDVDRAAAEIVTPSSIGRWRQVTDERLTRAVQDQAALALQWFGYYGDD